MLLGRGINQQQFKGKNILHRFNSICSFNSNLFAFYVGFGCKICVFCVLYLTNYSYMFVKLLEKRYIIHINCIFLVREKWWKRQTSQLKWNYRIRRIRRPRSIPWKCVNDPAKLRCHTWHTHRDPVCTCFQSYPVWLISKTSKSVSVYAHLKSNNYNHF